MSSERLHFAMSSGGLTLPDGRIALFGAEGDAPVDRLGNVQVIQTNAADVARFEQRGIAVATEPEGTYVAAIVTLPRARDRAEAMIAQAAQVAPLLVIDGAKTDGVEAILKAVKARATLEGQVSKAHGKCFWLHPGEAFADWARPAMTQTAAGDWTAPGVFSADAADPASIALAVALPDTLKGRFADLGAGWGWLSREVLKHESVKQLHLVEVEKTALDCARRNVEDPRAVCHWADATTWSPPTKLDGVVMNPPFHVGRKADPALGRAFIASAAKMLAPHGHLWMVANRHLPYETALSEQFREVAEIGGDNRFKILHAQRPARPKR
jgi:16S rRNA (guanine1207-N2)-methyltransferase